MIFFLGMHRKSMEAAQTLTNEILKDNKEDGQSDESSGDESEAAEDRMETKPNINDNKDDFRSNSIAALRAKAQEHSARFFSDGHKLFEQHQQQQQQQQQQTSHQQQMFSSLENNNQVF